MKNKKSVIHDISLISIFLSLSVLFKFISSFIKIINNYPIELEIAFLLIGIILLKDLKSKILLLILSPLLWLFVSPPFIYSSLQFFVEYFLTIYIFIPICFIRFNKRIKILNLIILILLSIICFVTKMFIHILSGAIWWTNNNWMFSLCFNFPIVGINLIINIFIIFVSIIPLLKIKNIFMLDEQKNRIKKIIYI